MMQRLLVNCNPVSELMERAALVSYGVLMSFKVQKFQFRKFLSVNKTMTSIGSSIMEARHPSTFFSHILISNLIIN